MDHLSQIKNRETVFEPRQYGPHFRIVFVSVAAKVDLDRIMSIQDLVEGVIQGAKFIPQALSFSQ